MYYLQVRDVEAVVKRFKTDLHNCVGYIQDPKMLKESIKALYQKHVQEDIVSTYISYSLTLVLRPNKKISVFSVTALNI